MVVVGTAPGSSDTFIPGIVFSTFGAVLCLITIILSAIRSLSDERESYEDGEYSITDEENATDYDESSCDLSRTREFADNKLTSRNSLYSGHGIEASLMESDDYVSAFSWSQW